MEKLKKSEKTKKKSEKTKKKKVKKLNELLISLKLNELLGKINCVPKSSSVPVAVGRKQDVSLGIVVHVAHEVTEQRQVVVWSRLHEVVIHATSDHCPEWASEEHELLLEIGILFAIVQELAIVLQNNVRN